MPLSCAVIAFDAAVGAPVGLGVYRRLLVQCDVQERNMQTDYRRMLARLLHCMVVKGSLVAVHVL